MLPPSGRHPQTMVSRRVLPQTVQNLDQLSRVKLLLCQIILKIYFQSISKNLVGICFSLTLINNVLILGPSASCPRTQYTYKYKSSSYLFMTASVDWLTAHMNCLTCGAQLVSIETEDENEYLRNVTKNTPHFAKCKIFQ